MEDQERNRVIFGRWGFESGEDVVVCRVNDTEIEIHCHGGMAAVQRILNDLAGMGCRLLEENDVSQSAQSIFEQEWEQALLRTSTEQTAHFLLVQRTLIPDCVRTLLSQELLALPERRLGVLEELLANARIGLKLAEPWQVVLTGRPNVGKSSLMNALLGFQRSVVYDQPGTTRDVVTGMTAMDGWPIHLSDTAGLRETEESIEQEGVRRAELARERADLVLHVLDHSEQLSEEDLLMARQMADSLLVVNKGDLAPAWNMASLPRDGLIVSSRNGTGLEELIAGIVSRLISHPPDEKTPLLFTDRQIRCAETARRALTEMNEDGFVDACRNLCEGGP